MQDAFQSWLNERQQGQFHRQLLLIQGTPDWVCQQAQTLTLGSETLWISEEQVPCKAYRQQLGREWDCLVYDLRSGVSANALVALSGTVRRGGLMVLLAPPIEHWQQDLPSLPGKQSFGTEKSTGVFNQWLLEKLQSASGVVIYNQQSFRGENMPVLTPLKDVPTPYASHEQALAVQAIHKVASGHRHRPLVLTADRGRGKTSALGIAAAQLMAQDKQILITAPHLDATEQAFNHAQQQLTDVQREKGYLKAQEGCLKFMPVDVLIREKPRADLLLVDEAAAIPAPLLKSLLNQYSRVVFSSTVHGYEGSGRGFEIRFKPYLEAHRPQWQSMHISEPLRWYQDDPLEQFWFDTLLMQDAPANQSTSDQPLYLQQHSKAQLAANPVLLHQIFELLVNAHYQTSPDDLQRMLDAPDMHIYSLQRQGQLLGAMLVMVEGGSPLSSLADAISLGQRRVQGHLLAQNLSAYLGEPALAALSYWRIVRIALQANSRRQGLGQWMLNELATTAKTKSIDALGTSYGLSNELLRFWQKAGFMPVRLGHKQDAASGEHSLLMLQALSEPAKQAQQQLTSYFSQEFQYLLPSTFAQLHAPLLLQLFGILCQPQILGHNDRRLLIAFSSGTQPLENLHLAMRKLLSQPKCKVHPGAELACRYVLQGWSIASICAEYNVAGKRQLSEQLRDWVNVALDEAL